MVLKECEIRFDNPFSTYYAGQTVNGTVVLTFDAPKKVRGIYIKIKGESNVSFSVEESRTNNENQTENERIDLSGHEEYFKTQYHIVGGPSGNDIELPVGQQVYPFTFVLPPTLPSSFEGEFGHVRYTIKVVLDRPWKFDQETKVAFTVLSPVDLNQVSSLREPQSILMEKTFCCCWCKSGPLTCVVNLPCRGYVPGQTMPILAEVDNISNVEVVSLSFTFQKVVTYHSQRPRRETKKDVIVLETVQVGPVPGHESKTWNQPMVIPSLPPSNLINCSIIDLDYELMIEAKVAGLHSNMISKVPLTIGTIPIGGINGVPSIPTAPPADVPQDHSTAIGWANPGGMFPSVPTFEASKFGTTTIKDSGDNEYTRINNSAYNPMYPVYNFENNA